MRRLDVSAEAELEVFEAALRYEREHESLGFRVLVREFPYGVFFTAEADVITVLAVLHLHRHPDTWKRERRDTR